MWDQRYDRKDYLFGTEPAAFLKGQAELLQPGLKALVVADGEGRNSVFLAEHGVETTAFDASPVAVEKAKALSRTKGVSVDFHVATIESWDFSPESFDLVVAIFIQFLGPEAMREAFTKMQAALKPGGRILLHGYRPKQLEYKTGGPPHLENLYTDLLLRDLFQDLTLERLESYDAEIEEGSGHVGISALIDLVGRKPA